MGKGNRHTQTLSLTTHQMVTLLACGDCKVKETNTCNPVWLDMKPHSIVGAANIRIECLLERKRD
jgi:hypothetical protein